MQLATFEIDVPPRQRPQFRGAQPGEDRGQQQRPPAALQMGNKRPNLIEARNIDADF